MWATKTVAVQAEGGWPTPSSSCDCEHLLNIFFPWNKHAVHPVVCKGLKDTQGRWPSERAVVKCEQVTHGAEHTQRFLEDLWLGQTQLEFDRDGWTYSLQKGHSSLVPQIQSVASRVYNPYICLWKGRGNVFNVSRAEHSPFVLILKNSWHILS